MEGNRLSNFTVREVGMSDELELLYYYGQLYVIEDAVDIKKILKWPPRTEKKKSTGEERLPESARDLARADDDGFAIARNA